MCSYFFKDQAIFLNLIYTIIQIYIILKYEKIVLMLMCFSSNTLFIFKEINVLQSGGKR